MRNRRKNILFLLAFSTALSTNAAKAEYSQAVNSLAGQDISYKDAQGDTQYVEDSHSNRLKYHESAYSVQQVTESDPYDFKIYIGLDANNKPQFEYYTYSLDGEHIAPNSLINVTKLDEAPAGGTCDASNNCFKVAKGVKENGRSDYEYYRYDLRGDGQEYASSTKIKSPTGDIEDLRFVGLGNSHESFGMGGGVEIRAEHVDLIKADFISNVINDSYNYGGAINSGGEHGDGSSIGNIVGDFVGNQGGGDYEYGYWSRGGAIYSRAGAINSIT